MIYLTAEQALFIHSRLISEIGGTHGLRDLGLLQSALARPQATFDGKELHPDLFSKAAALLYSLVNNHPFVDGNKRTGITCAGIFLRLNGWEIIATNEELEQYTLLVASSHPEIGEIRNWFKKHSHKRKDD